MNNRRYEIGATGPSSARRSVVREVNWLAEHFPDPEQQKDYARQKCVEAVAARIESLMEEAGLSQADLAAKLGKSQSQVSRLLSGAHNMTLFTLGEVLWACGRELRTLDDIPLGIVEIPIDDETALVQATSATGLSAAQEATVLRFDRASAS
jgi:transcriptional regulator with XRE-family HTH domain